MTSTQPLKFIVVNKVSNSARDDIDVLRIFQHPHISLGEFGFAYQAYWILCWPHRCGDSHQCAIKFTTHRYFHRSPPNTSILAFVSTRKNITVKDSYRFVLALLVTGLIQRKRKTIRSDTLDRHHIYSDQISRKKQ